MMTVVAMKTMIVFLAMKFFIIFGMSYGDYP
jgi:hypothetical protein